MSKGTIVVELPSNVDYVAGTVNGKDTVFVQDEFNLVKWRATVDVSPDNLYSIYLEMHDMAGNVGTYTATVEYFFPQFIYDRTQADIDRVKYLYEKGWGNMTNDERTEWSKGLKGAFNLSDAKRIEHNMYVLSELLRVEVANFKENLPEFPNSTYFRTLLDRIIVLRNVGYYYTTTPQVPSEPINTWKKLNDIELIMHDIYEVFNANFKHFAGEGLYAGEETNLLL